MVATLNGITFLCFIHYGCHSQRNNLPLSVSYTMVATVNIMVLCLLHTLKWNTLYNCVWTWKHVRQGAEDSHAYAYVTVLKMLTSQVRQVQKISSVYWSRQAARYIPECSVLRLHSAGPCWEVLWPGLVDGEKLCPFGQIHRSGTSQLKLYRLCGVFIAISLREVTPWT